MVASVGVGAHFVGEHRPMPDHCRIAPTPRAQIDKHRLAALAQQQNGALSRAQLHAGGVSGTTISRWRAEGRLHRIHPGVYALGHAALSLDGRLRAALLYAGNGALLSYTTAAWLWQVIDSEPRRIHVTISGRRRSLPGVRVHYCGQVDGVHCRGFLATSPARTLLDLAAVLPSRQLRRALAEVDYQGLLDPDAIRAVLGQGQPGSTALQAALANHLPELAQTMSVLEERFLELCRAGGLPMPEVNAKVGRMRVDALWRPERVVVELDGAAAHRGWAAIKRDRQRELALRSHGLAVARYTWDQVTHRATEVVADLRRLLQA
ncbi:MAG: type IV toxin-antitoxin system AbiEi family antitoxin domain-containing protein [Solirubrobacterales bacterium]